MSIKIKSTIAAAIVGVGIAIMAEGNLKQAAGCAMVLGSLGYMIGALVQYKYNKSK